MKIFKSSKRVKIFIASLTLVMLVCAAISPFTASAELVEVSNIENPTFEFKNIYSASSKGGYTPSDLCGITSQENGVYVMKSNSYVTWYTDCNVSYAYQKADFNAGNESVLTVKTTIDTYDGKEAGIQIRESLEANSALAMLTIRKDGFYFIWRSDTGVNCEYKVIKNNIVYGTDAAPNPINLKMTLDRKKGRITGEYKFGGDINDDSGWSSVCVYTFKKLVNLKSLYTGMINTTANEKVFADVKWSNYSVKLMAPEGYTVDGDGDSSKPTEPEVKIPDDDPATGDTILRETFTDTNLQPTDATVNDPYWTIRKGEAKLKVDDQKLNRYLAVEAGDDPLMMTAGDMGMTDYSVQMEFSFGSDVINTETNRIDLLFRHRSQVVGGSADYSVSIRNNIKNSNFAGQEISLRYRGGSNTFIPANGQQVVLASKVLSATEMLAPDVIHTIKVDVIDNRITVYFDDMTTPLFEYTDDNSKHTSDGNLKGCIGIVADSTCVNIDNIIVRDIPDPLGGDWDNEIQGNYDSPVPDWLKEKYGK